ILVQRLTLNTQDYHINTVDTSVIYTKHINTEQEQFYINHTHNNGTYTTDSTVAKLTAAVEYSHDTPRHNNNTSPCSGIRATLQYLSRFFWISVLYYLYFGLLLVRYIFKRKLILLLRYISPETFVTRYKIKS